MEAELKTEIEEICSWLGTGSINIFGMPFSGKDTHGHELARFFDARFISSGDILRSPASPAHVQQHIAKGHLAPTDEFINIVLPFLSQKELVKHPLILSSVGRWHGEEPSVLLAAKESGHAIKAVIYLDISETEAIRRWEAAERGREDDAAKHILLNRFNEFKIKTAPVVDHYRKLGLLIEIDGMPPKKVVTKDIVSKLSELSKTHKL